LKRRGHTSQPTAEQPINIKELWAVQLPTRKITPLDHQYLQYYSDAFGTFEMCFLQNPSMNSERVTRYYPLQIPSQSRQLIDSSLPVRFAVLAISSFHKDNNPELCWWYVESASIGIRAINLEYCATPDPFYASYNLAMLYADVEDITGLSLTHLSGMVGIFSCVCSARIPVTTGGQLWQMTVLLMDGSDHVWKSISNQWGIQGFRNSNFAKMISNNARDFQSVWKNVPKLDNVDLRVRPLITYLCILSQLKYYFISITNVLDGQTQTTSPTRTQLERTLSEMLALMKSTLTTLNPSIKQYIAALKRGGKPDFIKLHGESKLQQGLQIADYLWLQILEGTIRSKRRDWLQRLSQSIYRLYQFINDAEQEGFAEAELRHLFWPGIILNKSQFPNGIWFHIRRMLINRSSMDSISPCSSSQLHKGR
jgi:hypothetical protein